ncbi:MAG: hypothetical protein ACO3F5_03380 [Gemmatimonadaceae bacterium]|jgi:hypothetical protein
MLRPLLGYLFVAALFVLTHLFPAEGAGLMVAGTVTFLAMGGFRTPDPQHRRAITTAVVGTLGWLLGALLS